MYGFPECFSDFELCRPAISKPVVLEKSDIPQKKALNSGNWKQFWNWKDFCHGRLQTGFSKSDAFSVRWAWPSLGWCHAQFFSWFKELYIRAFQWYIICFRILVGTCSKLQKHMNKNLPRWFHSILAVYHTWYFTNQMMKSEHHPNFISKYSQLMLETPWKRNFWNPISPFWVTS